MPDQSATLESIKLFIMADATDADTTIASTAEKLRQFSKESGVSLRSLGEAFKGYSKEMGGLTVEMRAQITAAIALASAWEKADIARKKYNEKVSFSQAQAKVSGATDNSLGDSISNANRERARIEANRTSANIANTQGMLFSPKVADEFKKINEEAKKTPSVVKGAESAVGAFFSRIGSILSSHLILAAFKMIMDFFSGAYAVAKEYRGKMAELNFAEAVLSKKGMDISRAELDSFIANIEGKFKYLSKLEVTGIVSSVASMGAEFKLTKKDVTGLSEAVAFLQLKEQAYGMEVSDTGSIINAALDGRSNFFNALGINITKTAIKEKVYAMGLAKSGEAITKEMSNQAAIALLIEQTSGKFDELIASIEKVNPALANQLLVTKELKDSQVEVGNSVLGVKDAWNEFLASLIKSGGFDAMKEGLIGVITEVGNLIGAIENASTVITTFMKMTKGMNPKEDDKGLFWRVIFGRLNPYIAVQIVINILATILAQIMGWIATLWVEIAAGISPWQAFEDAGAVAREAWKFGWKKSGKILLGEDTLFSDAGKNAPKPGIMPETPTGNGGGGDEPDTRLQEALDKMNKEILDANIKLEQDLQDVTIDLERKRQDILIKYAKKRAEIEKDYADKIIDINRTYADKEHDLAVRQAEANQAARNNELEREREFQNNLRKMKEKFLMDLEDALHARDARQILKLIKQYELEKLQAERAHALDVTNAAADERLRQESMARERADLEEEKQRKLRDAQEDYQNKIAKLQADQQAEEDAARLAALRKIEDLNKNNADMLAQKLANFAQEYALTESELGKLVGLYQKYYTDVSAIYTALAQLRISAGMMAQPTHPSYTASGVTSGHEQGNIGGGYAEGGSVIANRPTKAIFGERGMELATFTPIGRNGKDMNKLFSNLGGSSGGNGTGGQVSIELLLSPDLESRIVKNTLNKTGEIITRVGRSKN